MVIKIGNKFVSWEKSGRGIYTVYTYSLQKERPEESTATEIARRSRQMSFIGFARFKEMEFC